MNVLMFGWEFPPHISGGLGTACQGLTEGLAAQDVHIVFVVPKVFGDEAQAHLQLVGANRVRVSKKRMPELLQEIDMTYIEVGTAMQPYTSPEYFREKFRGKAKSIVQDLAGEGFIDFAGDYTPDLLHEVAQFAHVAGRIAQHYPHDVIHANEWLTFGAGIAARKVSGKPLIAHVHATEYDRSGPHRNPHVQKIEQQGLRQADAVITVSRRTQRRVVGQYGIAPKKITTIYNAASPQHANYQPKLKKGVKEKLITFLGRVTYQKGPGYFLEAANLLRHKNNFRFVMAGDGDLLHSMMQKAAALGLSGRFHFTGFLHNENVDELLRMSDVFVMPSVSEPFGIAPLEALTSGVPVIVSRQSGVAEVLDYVLKVDFWDTPALADAIHAVLQYGSIGKFMHTHGKPQADALTWDNAAQSVRRLYETVEKPYKTFTT